MSKTLGLQLKVKQSQEKQATSLKALVNLGKISVEDRNKLMNLQKGIANGSIEESEFETTKYFKLQIPTSLPNVNADILNPRNAWKDKDAYQETAVKLAKEFKANFNKFIATDSGKAVQEFGPEC